MGWLGWMSYGGTEIINGPRFEAYARNDGAAWFSPTFKLPELALVLGDPLYRSPLQDLDTPWTDPDDPDSYDFYGVFPLDAVGYDSSTRTSVITESTGDGGNPGRLRHTTKQIVYTVLLAGRTEAAVYSGMAWLRAALLAGSDGCRDWGGCDSATLCYLSAEPVWEQGLLVQCADDYLRFLHRVVVNTGPTVTAKNTMGDGSAVWQVTFTAVAGIPWEFGDPEPIVTGFMNPSVPDPNVAGGDYDGHGHIFTEVACPKPSYTPLFDPSCPNLVLPPAAPSIPLGCFTPPVNWTRTRFNIPADYVRLWTDAVPLIKLTVASTTTALHNVRVRIFADPDGTIDPDEHPCDFCADFLVSYIPPQSTMTIDGRDETVTVTGLGQSRRGDSLVYSSDGTPFSWPQLSCGVGYVVTVDKEQTSAVPYVDFDLVPKAR